MSELEKCPYIDIADVVCPLRDKTIDKKDGHLYEECMSYNVGKSDYSKHKHQPWDLWEEYKLDPWDADIAKRVLRRKDGESPITDYEKIKHICDKKIALIKNGWELYPNYYGMDINTLKENLDDKD